MSKLDEFKIFIKDKKFLIDKVHNNEISWQKLYETYDIYGPEHEIFKEKIVTPKPSSLLTKDGLASALSVIKNVDLEKVSSGLENVKKVVGAIQEITKPITKEVNVPEYVKKSSFRRYND